MTTLVLQGPTINAYLQPNFHDATFVAKVQQKNQAELKKINDDFGQSYRFQSTTIHVKEPFKLRLDANVEDTTVSYIANGTRQIFKVPRIKLPIPGLNKVQDVSDQPGRRQTLMDFGILTNSIVDELFDAKFVRMDRATGDAVFDLTYKSKFHDRNRFRVWLDPNKHFIEKREWTNRKGRMVATFIYDSPVNDGGVWMPTKLTVKNADDAVAGVTKYESVKINAGVSDDLFAF